AGRKDAEVNERGYTPWTIKPGTSAERAFNRVKITFSKAGNVGSELTTDWYKAGIQDPNYAKLISDGIRVDDGDKGGQIKMRISGLSPGKHTLLTFHNFVRSPEGNSFSPIDIYVDGKRQISHLKPSDRILDKSNAATAYL